MYLQLTVGTMVLPFFINVNIKRTKTHTCPSPMDKMQISALSKLSHFR
ncbi:conserved hypothetical protein [Staphylococcus aureus]|uniref:Uncharacterized protein n=1 Tax=Staphylococcus aureus (strain COL) TaxID=93062 RepID=A0A0H2X287_STAAC|nr:hypothetical protein SACOL0492 [Staphylococcus aureus subsp. aureus COL]ABX28479.1 hypothetical protein USA300HOU_0453 [Staphylococcus aureus subsp. aureus USA300_TCH1516]EFU27040.1 hypothetical protein CGSSa01_06742 [Staphylococcus aureus subsp. aureus CGS01]CRI23328.1 conserved hypothetical protein [Staphylococcus aureus]CRI27300.1 conserved hypothetical protein [Staphylococcus aureus]